MSEEEKFNTLFKKVDLLSDSINTLKLQVQSLSDQNKVEDKMLNDVKTELKDISYLLKGNGEIGIMGKVNVLWKSTIFVIMITVGTLIKTFF